MAAERNALVLSGGNLKGAYQAGAIQSVLAGGFRPDIVTGISVGALNAAYLAAHQPNAAEQWPAVGTALVDFWRTNITSPKKLVKKRGPLELVYRLLFKKWDGFVSTDPMAKLVTAELGSLLPSTGPLDVRVGDVSLYSGWLTYTQATQASFLDAVLASSAEPILMPVRSVSGIKAYDGGLRDIAPLREAISAGATRIVAIICQPEDDPPETFNTGDVLALAYRVMGIITNEIINNDLGTFLGVNQALQAWPTETPLPPDLAGKRYIPLTVIRPGTALAGGVTAFDRATVAALIQRGQEDAGAAMSTST